MNTYDFTRDIYSELVKWTATKKGLLLKGPRQVGKTYILTKLAKEKFNSYLYVNLGNKAVFNWFEENAAKAFSGQIWADVFERYAKEHGQTFENKPETLVVLDEIQSSSLVFNSIREMVRECNFRLVATGSYLGIMDLENFFSNNKQSYFYPMGDIQVLEIWPMTYREVCTACASYDDSIDSETAYKY